MGSANSEKERYPNEGPQREVTISKSFYMGVYEVTQGQWTAVMGTTPWKDNDKEKDSVKEGEANAATYINWNDASDFCKKLSTKTGKAVALPTEAQWEYACRAGTKTRFYYGDDIDDYRGLADYGWYRKNSWDAGERYAHAAGQRKPNAWGLYDMHGNVFEWCSDWFADSYSNAGKADPVGPASGTLRVLRGGSFFNYGLRCRSAYRHSTAPTTGWRVSGFRVTVASDGT
jgi:formylglycine-generating enzyme